MPSFVKYKPYPDSEFGTGDFTTDDGRTVPLYHPAEAQRLLSESPDASAPQPPPPAPAPPVDVPVAPAPEPSKIGPRLKDAEADTAMRQRSMEIVNDKNVPMGAVVPVADGIVGRVEEHNWTNKGGKRVPGKYRGVTLYRTAPPPDAPQPTAELDQSQQLSSQDPNTSVPESRSDASGPVPEINIGPAQIEKKSKIAYNPDEKAVLDQLVKKYPGTSEEGFTNLFYGESGGSPTAVNPKSGAAGIFQLMPDQAKAMGVDDMTKLSRAQQMALYDQYLQSHNVKPKSDVDLYMANAAPNAVGAPDNRVVYGSGTEFGEKAIRDNPGWVETEGPNKGQVTAGSIRRFYEKNGIAGGEPGAGDPDLSGLTARQQQIAKYLNAPNAGGSATTTTQKLESGVPLAQSDIDKYNAMSDKRAGMIQDAFGPTIAAQQDLVKQQLARAEEIKAAQAAAQAKENAARDHYDESITRVRDATNAVLADKEPPPFGGNVFAGIMAAVAQGMGAYAAAITHTNNFASDIINNALKRDSMRWQQTHLDKEFKVKEEKELSTNQWHDYQTQKSERELQQRLLVDHELQQQLGSAKSAETQRALGLMLKDNQAHTDDLLMNLQHLSHGKVTTEIQTQQQPGSAVTLPEVNKRAADLAAGGDSPEDIAAARATASGGPGTVPVKSEDRVKYSEGVGNGWGRAKLDEGERALVSMAKDLDLTFDEKTGKFTPVKGKENIDKLARNPFTGEASGPFMQTAQHALQPRFLGGPDSSLQENKDVYTNAKSALMQAVYADSGKQINENEVKQKVEQYMGLNRENQITNINHLMESLRNKKALLNKTFPGAASDYDTRGASQENTNGVDVNFTPGVSP